MKWVVVVENGFFKVMADDGLELRQASEYGKPCVFESLLAASKCAERLNRLYACEGSLV